MGTARADELPFLPRTGWPFSSKTSTSMPEPARLDLAAPHRRDRIAADEAADDVGAAGDGGQVHVRA